MADHQGQSLISNYSPRLPDDIFGLIVNPILCLDPCKSILKLNIGQPRNSLAAFDHCRCDGKKIKRIGDFRRYEAVLAGAVPFGKVLRHL
jgi:hypothetical protein